MASSSSKRSEVWKYFSQIDGKSKVKCNLCATELSHTGGSTGTMKNHLKFKHHSIKTESANVPMRQSSINSMLAAKTMSRDKYQRCTQKLALMCSRDLRPLSIVEGAGFKDFCNELNPSFQVPCAKTIANYVSLSYDQHASCLKDILKSQTGIALTSDHWTSLATEGYITVTAHFVDSDWRYQNCVLSTRHVTERHTGENTSSEIKSITDKFQINSKSIEAIVTDNASNMVSCVQHLSWPHVRCFGHTLQLSIRGAFDSNNAITKTIAAAKKLVAHFRRSVVANNELHIRQKQMNLPENNLMIDCTTRWNSTFDMFERLKQQRLPVYAVLHDSNVTKTCDARVLDMTDDQWRIIEGMIPVLKPLYMATRVMCSEEYPTVSGVYPIVYSLLTHHLQVSEADTTAVAAFKNFVSTDLKKQFQ